ncbi:MAG TPA: helix-turn-helix transcriptional regulator [Candidatus Omnitrophota bacterium]|nr:helix-turn-helix transcriptional regulator [Candidatus Omnitrophota bacterium]
MGGRIQTLRKKKQLSQEELAEQAGIHRTYIGAVERGEKNATIETLEKIASALNIKVGELFD